MIPEREREALMRLTMCAREECSMCKYTYSCNYDFQYKLATENMNILADALRADRKTEPTHDLRTETHECVKDTHDKTESTICDFCRYYNSNIPCGSTPSACKEADKFAEEFVNGLKDLRIEADRKTEATGYNLSPVEDEPTISKMEQVEDEPQTYKPTCNGECRNCDYRAKDGNYCMKTDCAWK